MRYLVTARVRPGMEEALLRAIDSGELGRGSVAGREYLRNMTDACLRDNGLLRWVEVCFCDVPLDEERPYWEEYFELVKVQDAHARSRCRDLDGSEPWACGDCDCTERLEARLQTQGNHFWPRCAPPWRLIPTSPKRERGKWTARRYSPSLALRASVASHRLSRRCRL